MRSKLLIWLFLWSWLVACSDDDKAFDIPMTGNYFKGTVAVPGGAVMRFVLPDHDDVFGLNVRYVDGAGHEVLKAAGYGSDSLLLDGFNAPRTDVPARVTLVDRANRESEPFDITFSTLASAAYAFFDDIEISPSWNGFQLIYKAPEMVDGVVHIYYEGINPKTQKMDTLWVKSFPITQGGDTLVIPLTTGNESNTVILRTQDNKGNRVGQVVKENVESYQPYMLTWKDDFDFIADLSVEDEEACLGIQYLFDGDQKGTRHMQAEYNYQVYTFFAGPNALDKPFFVDLKQPRVPAAIRIYGMLDKDRQVPGSSYSDSKPYAKQWNGSYATKLPCEITVYGGNDMEGDEWTRLAYFEQNSWTPNEDRWSYKCCDQEGWDITKLEQLEEMEAEYLELFFPALEVEYRYLKIVIGDTYDYIDTVRDWNPQEFVAMQELEVYVKKD